VTEALIEPPPRLKSSGGGVASEQLSMWLRPGAEI